MQQARQLIRASFIKDQEHVRLKHAMNRPRNRQPRPAQGSRSNQHPNNPNRQTYQNQRYQQPSSVPTIQQVKPGTNVSIILKADQRTGREVQGVVQDLLTRGNHPWGIKVRLQDGRVGRVQRMVTSSNLLPFSPVQAGAPLGQSAGAVPGVSRTTANQAINTIAPGSAAPTEDDNENFIRFDDEARWPSPDTVVCPICNDFEGDEDAVAFHAQQHLDQS